MGYCIMGTFLAYLAVPIHSEYLETAYMAEDKGAKSQSQTLAPSHDPAPDDRMPPEQARTDQSPFVRALCWIGLDLTGPERASILQIGIYALLVFIPIALLARFVLHLEGVWLFITS